MENPKRRYIRGFDGLRALAVIGVILFHLMPTKFVGGWFGVPLFFVISGYLITDQLIQEFDRNHKIAIFKFYKRRIKRLYPALVVMLLIVTTIILLFDRQLIYNLRPTVETNLLYIFNFWAVNHGSSYFQQFGGASPFTHLWSLSIEGQFYFIWPLVVWVILRLALKRENIARVLILFSLLSAILMAVLYEPTAINRVYYGTDTRLFAILLGTAVAFVWPSIKLTNYVSNKVRRYLNIAGLCSFLLWMLGTLWLNGQQPATYYGLMYLLTIASTILVAVTAHPASLFSKVLDNKILNYLGKRSYSIYLYQLPVFVFYEKFIPHYQPNLLNILIEIVLVLLVSEVSYRYVENFFRNGQKLRQYGRWIVQSRNRFFLILTPTLIFLLFIGHGLASQDAGRPQPQTALQKKLLKNKLAVRKSNKKAQQANKQAPKKSNNQSMSTDDKKIVATYDLNATQYMNFKNMSFTAIGDSVMLDSAPYLQEINPKIFVDAKVGRQAYEAPELVKSMSNNNELAPNILVGLGTNGEIRRQDLDRMMKTFGTKRQVYWINNLVQSKPWQEDNNDMLAKANSDYKNLHIVDWYSLAKEHSDWFADDGVHQGPLGARNYVRLIVEKTGEVNKIK
ncbi:acetyltransferase [Leuconostoc koreense]|nr:acetyltransferase [Leuconostoc mesenteroides]QGM25392.1 acyltransferase family protein [Leuconostoc mesenteroides subsp. mesenteroides]